jgi:hypothetical protein
MELELQVHIISMVAAGALAVILLAGAVVAVILYQVGKQMSYCRACGKRNR